jgi:hypothetical protein
VGMLWAARSGKQATANAANQPQSNQPPGGLPQGSAGSGAVQVAQGPQVTQQPSTQGAPITGQQPVTQNGTQNPTPLGGQNAGLSDQSPQNSAANVNSAPAARQRPDRERLPALAARQLGPAPINPQISSQGGRLGRGALPDAGGTRVILPDTGPDTTPGIATGTRDNSSAPQTPVTTNPPPQGRIEIIVSPGPGGANDRTGSSSKGTVGDPGVSLDSRSALEIARDLHNRGQYAKAVKSYKSALDGAGDGAADIHQKIALCYYRLGEKENAISHYQQAIESFRAQVAAGRNVESAKNGIRACENGIKVCQ